MSQPRAATSSNSPWPSQGVSRLEFSVGYFLAMAPDCHCPGTHQVPSHSNGDPCSLRCPGCRVSHFSCPEQGCCACTSVRTKYGNMDTGVSVSQLLPCTIWSGSTKATGPGPGFQRTHG